MVAPWRQIFPHSLTKKLSKTAEARTGKGIYKRRNSRNYRVVMHYSTYKDIIETQPEFLANYENGYAVRVSPEEYFENINDLPEGLELGKNAFVYYKTISSYEKYPPLEDWMEVYELYTSNSANKPKDPTEHWVGHYATFINNTNPRIVSMICERGNASRKEELADIKDQLASEYNLAKVPTQAGLGNFDYDYATNEEVLNIQYQLAYLMLKVDGMKNHLFQLAQNDLELAEPELKFPANAYKIIAQKGEEGYSELFDKAFSKIEAHCEEHNLLNFNKLSSIRAWDDITNQPICPLCLEALSAEDFFKVAEQDSGREEEDNTQSEIALMHIHALEPGELNHRVYNLGWGHRHCNSIQEGMDIETTIQRLRQIVSNNEGNLQPNEEIPVDELAPHE